jgi:ABC-type dipeptide/oligopeptide/nickel transport system permease component
MSAKLILANFLPALNDLYGYLKRILVPFLTVTFIIYSLFYITPGSKGFEAELIWPFSYLIWIIDFFSGSLMNQDFYLAYFYTLQLVAGSLLLSALIVLVLYFFHKRNAGTIVKGFERLIKVSSGFHILIISLIFYKFFPHLRDASPLHPVFLLILAFGNGSIAEFYNSLEAEFDKVFQKEYALAAVAWGHNVYRYSLRETLIILIEILNARIPIAVSSTIVIEWLFNLDGLSYIILDSIKGREFGDLMISTALIAFTIIFVNVLTEIIRNRLDPRVRLI